MTKTTKIFKVVLIIIPVIFFVIIAYFAIRQIVISNSIPPFSGALPEPKATPNQQEILFAQLRDSCPIKETGFEIDFNYSENRFVVYIETPLDTNRNLFNQWLVDNKYDLITADNFVFGLKQ